MDLNKVMLIGRLTRDPETRTTNSGQQVTSFSLATGRQWTDKATGQKKSQSEFHNIVAWNGSAKIASDYLKKGSHVYIEGKLQTRSWDIPDGYKAFKTEVVVDQLIMLSSTPKTETQDVQEDVVVDDIPF